MVVLPSVLHFNSLARRHVTSKAHYLSAVGRNYCNLGQPRVLSMNNIIVNKGVYFLTAYFIIILFLIL